MPSKACSLSPRTLSFPWRRVLSPCRRVNEARVRRARTGPGTAPEILQLHTPAAFTTACNTTTQGPRATSTTHVNSTMHPRRPHRRRLNPYPARSQVGRPSYVFYYRAPVCRRAGVGQISSLLTKRNKAPSVVGADVAIRRWAAHAQPALRRWCRYRRRRQWIRHRLG